MMAPTSSFRCRRGSRGRLVEQSPFAEPIRDYIHNFIVGDLLKLTGGFSWRLSLDDNLLFLDVIAPKRSRRIRVTPEPRVLAEWLRRYRARESAPRTPRPPAGGVGDNLRCLARLVSLDDAERQVLQLLLAIDDSGALEDLVDELGQVSLADAVRVLAVLANLPRERVLAALHPGSRLITSGIVQVADHAQFTSAMVDVKDGILETILTPGLDLARLLGRFLPHSPPPTLEWEDFRHVRDQASLARDLLRAALGAGRAGVNVLLYGSTGTGKTELARLLASDLGVGLYTAGKANEAGESASAKERLGSLLLGQHLIGPGQALVLFDEIEDLFDSGWPSAFGLRGRESRMSKQWFNDRLETNPVPTIWITNCTDGIDEAFLRRFTYVIEMEPLGARHRARVLNRHVRSDDSLSSDDVDAIADRFQASPAQIATAVATARLLGPGGRPDRATIERVLTPAVKLVTGDDPARRSIFDPSTYRLEFVNCPDDLAALADSLAAFRPGPGPGSSLCLHGPPGTGKSQFVRYLAHRMGRRLVHRRPSDILDCWVGGTEKKIARAFREAESDDAVLLFDEVETFLFDRRRAARSWEITLVNEFLQQLEVFHGVVACTSNLADELDPACLRRFVFKLELRYLRSDQAAALFRATWPGVLSDDDPAVPALAAVPYLTPGDFAAVARRVRALTALTSAPPAAKLVELLRREVEAKRLRASSLGFRSGPPG